MAYLLKGDIIKIMKKIALIIASKDFRDEEYFQTKEVLERKGFKIKTFSNEKGIAIGRFGGEVQVDDIINNLNVDDFEAVVFIGGMGAVQFLDDEVSYKIAKQTLEKGKVLAAICIAPTILAKAGVLQGKKCTVWSSNMDKSAIKTIKENGGIYEEKNVVIDGNIITADNFEAAQLFGQSIAEACLKSSS